MEDNTKGHKASPDAAGRQLGGKDGQPGGSREAIPGGDLIGKPRPASVLKMNKLDITCTPGWTLFQNTPHGPPGMPLATLLSDMQGVKYNAIVFDSNATRHYIANVNAEPKTVIAGNPGRNERHRCLPR